MLAYTEPILLVTPEPSPAMNIKNSNSLLRAVTCRSGAEFCEAMCEICLSLSPTSATPRRLRYS